MAPRWNKSYYVLLNLSQPYLMPPTIKAMVKSSLSEILKTGNGITTSSLDPNMPPSFHFEFG